MNFDNGEQDRLGVTHGPDLAFAGDAAIVSDESASAIDCSHIVVLSLACMGPATVGPEQLYHGVGPEEAPDALLQTAFGKTKSDARLSQPTKH